MINAAVRLVFLLSLLLCISGVFAASKGQIQSESNAHRKDVFFIISHTESDEWAKRLFGTFRETLAENERDTDITLAELGVRRTKDCKPDTNVVAQIVEYIKHNKPDLIVVSESPAIDALFPKYEEQLRGFPVILCSFPVSRHFDRSKYSDAAVLKYDIDLLGNVKLGMKLFPRTKKIAIITDATSQGIGIETIARERLKNFDGAEIKYFNGSRSSTQELIDGISQMPEESFIIFVSWRSTKSEVYISPRNVMAKICKMRKIPILSPKGLGLKFALGGIMSNDVENGQYLAETAMSIFDGKTPKDIPVRQPDMVLRCNAEMLGLFGLKRSNLPRSTVFYNESRPVIDFSSPLVQTVSGMILLIIVFFEVRSKIQNAKAIVKLRAGKDREYELRKLLEATFDISPFGITVKDPENDYRFVMCNRVFSEMVDRPIPEIIGKNDAELNVPTFDAADCSAEDKKVIENGEKISRTETFQTQSGTRVYNVVKLPLKMRGEKKLAVGIFHDITEQTESHERLKSAMRDAQAANRAKSFFLASMSHEIRTPLNAIIGFSDLLSDSSVDRKIVSEYIKNINFSAKALLDLLNDVLDLSKLESGMMQFASVETDFSELCNRVAKVFESKAASNGVALEVKVANIPTLFVDRQRLRQILFNLVGNAVKFTYEGRIEISAKFDRISSDTGNLEFSVSDTGMGISEEDQKTLFKPFVQSHTILGTGVAKSGTGLGLAICRQMLNRMNGEIDLISTLGKGSVFTVKLDEIKFTEGKPQPNNKKKIGNNIAGKKLLIVDDVKMNLKVLEAILRRAGANVVALESGEDALKAIKSERFDAVLTDMWMPKMSGEYLSKAIKAHNADMPVYAVTADLDSERNFDTVAIDGILTKPITIEKLGKVFEGSEHRV